MDQLQLTESANHSVRFLILRQKFYELLEAQGAAEAMACLREQIAPLEAQGIREHTGGDVDFWAAEAARQGVEGEAAPSPSLGRTVRELR